VSVAATSVAAARGAGRTVDRLLERPRTVLGTLVGTQVLFTIVLAVKVRHNGWVYFQGGDQILLTTTGWLLGQLQLPPAEISYLWPLLQVPITWLTGPTFVQALPAILILNVVVLGPIGLLCVYGIAARIGGRLLGYWTALLWVIAPYAAIPLFVARYHQKWTEQFLPQATGLTAMADFPSMVAVLAAAYFVTRSLTPSRLADAALAGVLLGAAGGLKPPNLILGFGAVLAYLVARRWREVVVFGAAVVPTLLVLAFWKERGLGIVPAFAAGGTRLAMVVHTPLAISNPLHQYFQLDIHHWRVQMDSLREFFWSARLAQWAPFAGVLAVLRVRRSALAALLGGWLGAFILIKGFSDRADIQANTFWRLLMPAWPAYLILFASIPLLVPTFARRLGGRLAAPESKPPVRWRWVGVALALTVVVPAAATAASTRISPPTPAIEQVQSDGSNLLTPVDDSVRLTTTHVGRAAKLTWSDPAWRAHVFYRVYRSTRTDPNGDLACVTSNTVTWYCYLYAKPIATTREHTFVDPSAPRGAIYRIGVGTNWANDPNLGDIFAFSPSVKIGP
jgi:hypothetical protein